METEYYSGNLSMLVCLVCVPVFLIYLCKCKCPEFDEQFTRREAGLCFVAANEVNVDEVSSYGHLELSFVEFLVAIGHGERSRS